MFHNATQPENPCDRAEEILERLRLSAHRIASRSRTRRERMLVKMITSFNDLPGSPPQETQRDAGVPSPEIVEAMRSPAGTQQLVSTRISGRRLRVVINPLGESNPEREAAVWQCLVDLVGEHVA